VRTVVVVAGRRVRLGGLRPGSLFQTDAGSRAVKSQYRSNGVSECILLDSGEYLANLPQGDDTLVRELRLAEVES
jgi:hypothetical protein